MKNQDKERKLLDVIHFVRETSAARPPAIEHLVDLSRVAPGQSQVSVEGNRDFIPQEAPVLQITLTLTLIGGTCPPNDAMPRFGSE